MSKRSTPRVSSHAGDEEDPAAFSPVLLKGSTAGGKQGNLTGSARKVKDAAADLHNLLQKWNSLNMQGSGVINEMANIKLECILGQEASESGRSDEAKSPWPETLEPLCDTLMGIYKQMEKVVKKLSGLAEMLAGVAQLESYQASREGQGADVILFQTWNLQQFYKTFTEIKEAYKTELDLKRVLMENVCHGEDRDTIMFYTSAWLHQPYIEDNIQLLLESVLLETGHKT